MTNARGRSAAARRGTDSAEWFIPDLCQPFAVLMLVLVAELLALVLTVAAHGLRDFAWSAFGTTSLFVQWVVLTSAGGLCLGRQHFARRSRPVAAAIAYGWILLVTTLATLAGQWLTAVPAAGASWRPDGWQLGGNLLIASILAGIALRYFYLAHELRLRQQAALSAQVQAMQSRIQPHFLFNTMNSIASLIQSDPEAAEAAVEDLAALFRASLAEATVEVPLHEELALCERYLRIEQWRLGERLQVRWQTDGLPSALPIPALTLQPLLENAITHGIQQLPAGGEVRVEGVYDHGRLQLRVSNPLSATAPSRSGNQLALDNIGHRLRALYGDDARLVVRREEDRFCAVLSYRVDVQKDWQ